MDGGFLGGQFDFEAAFAGELVFSAAPNLAGTFDDVGIQFQLTGEVEVVATLDIDFAISAFFDADSTPKVQNVLAGFRKFELGLQIGADLTLDVLVGIVDGTASGLAALELNYMRIPTYPDNPPVGMGQSAHIFSGSANVSLECDVSIGAVSLSDLNSEGSLPTIILEVPDLFNLSTRDFRLENFNILEQFVDFTPRTLLLLFRMLDQFLEDYTNT